ncbi:tyrosine-protein phosphatase [Tomitella gaofuii]|uniref:tyrosine-protein phosphatase n=1 Tax=Tomitella gaofuii TaxID=2760083 RepID=UPI0015F8F670|nr:tyrosine-protein phosphatase [Tomitella gaofuii]
MTPAGRQLVLEGAHNVRDLGGFAARDGRTTVGGRLFRGDGLSALTERDVRTLADAGITTVVDFRGVGEAAATGPDRLPPGTRLVRAPVLDDATQALAAAVVSAFDSGDRAALERMMGVGKAGAIAERGLVRQMDSRAAMDGYARTIGETAAARNALLFHCTGGKDRTGMMAAVALGLLGVPDDAIIADYLASNEYNREKNEALYARLGALGIDPGLLRPLTEQHPEEMRAVLDAVRTRFGGWDAFAADWLRLGVATVTAFRARLLE